MESSAPDTSSTPPPAVALAPPVPAVPAELPAAYPLCSNCGAELHGPHCYSCGQPVKGMIRPLSSMMHDVADTIFNIDSRIFRTLLPLYFRPGYLSNEYFAGRRVRYVTPFRLYFFLSIVAFLLIQTGLDSSLDSARDIIQFDTSDTNISSALTVEEVTARRDKALADIARAKTTAGVPDIAAKGFARAEEKIRAQADKRIEKLKDDLAKGVPQKTKSADDDDLDLSAWDPKAKPVHIAWLPDFVNARLTNAGARMKENVPKIRKDPKPFLIGAFGTLPQVLFVLMPLFALLLKIFYLFKRRLYMEHLIVALHSHSFIFLSLVFITLAILARGWARTAAPWLEMLLGWLIFVMCWWLPIYLFLTAKKVYKQGWFFTFVKFGLIGICYTVMISLGVVVAFVVSLATTT